MTGRPFVEAGDIGGERMTPTVGRHEGQDEIGGRGSVFAPVVVGVDGTEAGFEACRQAARLADPEALIDAIAVVHVSEAVRSDLDSAGVTDELQAEADKALERAVELIGERARARFLDGFVAEALRCEATRVDARLLAVGTHGHRRMTEIVVGGVAGELLHAAPCSVLVARAPVEAESFPRSIVVGVDGSPCSEYALEAAEQLAERLDVPVRAVTATRAADVELVEVRRLFPRAEGIKARPVEALVGVSREAGLVVVGSRGLHGIHALGSVSERVAHQASCSVLVVRGSDSS